MAVGRLQETLGFWQSGLEIKTKEAYSQRLVPSGQPDGLCIKGYGLFLS